MLIMYCYLMYGNVSIIFVSYKSFLIRNSFDRGAERYERWFGALIRDDNPSRRFADGAHPNQRTYALYSLDVLDAL